VYSSIWRRKTRPDLNRGFGRFDIMPDFYRRDLVTAETQEVEETLAATLGRHEIALARLRRALPQPSSAIVRELEAAEAAVRAAQARRDAIRR
jgi:hypothetical protein